MIFKRGISYLPEVDNAGTIKWWFCFLLQKNVPSPRFLLNTLSYFYCEKRLSHHLLVSSFLLAPRTVDSRLSPYDMNLWCKDGPKSPVTSFSQSPVVLLLTAALCSWRKTVESDLCVLKFLWLVNRCRDAVRQGPRQHRRDSNIFHVPDRLEGVFSHSPLQISPWKGWSVVQPTSLASAASTV